MILHHTLKQFRKNGLDSMKLFFVFKPRRLPRLLEVTTTVDWPGFYPRDRRESPGQSETPHFEPQTKAHHGTWVLRHRLQLNAHGRKSPLNEVENYY